MWIVLFSILLDVVGYGIISPILPFYARNLGAGPEVVTLCLALHSGMMFFSTPAWGRASDRFGRKPILIAGLAGGVASYVWMASAESILSLAGARILGGAMAGNVAAAFAFIADSTSEEERARHMGYAGACVGLGFVIGPAIGAWLGGSHFDDANFAGPALAAGGLSFVAMLGVLLFVRESRPASVRDAAPEAGSDAPKPQGLIREIAALRHRRTLVLIIACIATYQAAGGLYEPVFPLWAADLNLIQGPDGMLPMLVAGGAGYMIVQAFLIGPLTRRFDLLTLLRAGALGIIVSPLLVTIAGANGSVAAVVVLFGLNAAFAALILTATQTLISKQARADERGIVMGVFSSVGTLGRTIATVLSGFVYGQIHLHAPYWGASVLGLFIFGIAVALGAAITAAQREDELTAENDSAERLRPAESNPA